MLANYVLSKRVSGTSREDAELEISQLTDSDQFEIEDPAMCVARYICAHLVDCIDPRYTPSFIRGLLEKTGTYRLLPVSEDTEIYLASSGDTYRYDIYGSYSVRHIFQVQHYDPDDVVYLASEHIVNPSPDCDLLQRCYHTYFENPADAVHYCEQRMERYDIAHGSSASGYRVTVHPRSVLDQSVWYKKNLEAAAYIEKYDLGIEDYRYIVDMNELIDTVMADAYDDLPVSERAVVDRHIYDNIRDFISSDTSYAIDESIDHVDGDELKSMVDVAIVMAFAQAKDADTFNAIYRAIGPNAYRVACLTDDIFNNHPEQGYIIITKTGQMGWLPESDVFMNTWDGIKNSAIYGKLQPNENDTLYCLREFHPDMFLDKLPELMELDKYRRMYQSFIADQRKEHPEFRRATQNGKTVACGDWYPKGVLDHSVYKNTTFPCNYGEHEFSDEECKQLLSGEELAIPNYLTKMGSRITVRGKLKDISTRFDDGPYICFSRTDIGSPMRTSLNAEFGIQEPGLPSD